jgi:hypothetical protein
MSWHVGAAPSPQGAFAAAQLMRQRLQPLSATHVFSTSQNLSKREERVSVRSPLLPSCCVSQA